MTMSMEIYSGAWVHSGFLKVGETRKRKFYYNLSSKLVDCPNEFFAVHLDYGML
jgi:hypothetical protein